MTSYAEYARTVNINEATEFPEQFNYQELVKECKNAINQNMNIAIAMNNLGWLEIFGLGCEKDVVSGVYWLKRSCDLTNPVAYYNLGYLMISGAGLAYDYATGLKYWDKAAALNFGTAFTALGQQKHKNLDYVNAYNLFCKGAALGDINGILMVGEYYFNGNGSVSIDIDKACEHYIAATIKTNTSTKFYQCMVKKFAEVYNSPLYSPDKLFGMLFNLKEQFPIFNDVLAKIIPAQVFAIMAERDRLAKENAKKDAMLAALQQPQQQLQQQQQQQLDISNKKRRLEGEAMNQ